MIIIIIKDNQYYHHQGRAVVGCLTERTHCASRATRLLAPLEKSSADGKDIIWKYMYNWTWSKTKRNLLQNFFMLSIKVQGVFTVAPHFLALKKEKNLISFSSSYNNHFRAICPKFSDWFMRLSKYEDQKPALVRRSSTFAPLS